MYGAIMFCYFLAAMFIKKKNPVSALVAAIGLSIGIFFVGLIGGALFKVSAGIIAILKIVLALLCLVQLCMSK